MTELAQAPAEERTETKRIGHWIGGERVQGESGRSAMHAPRASTDSASRPRPRWQRPSWKSDQ